jgi:hypothetical protein
MAKLTLNADPEVIEMAKRIARERGTSVSAIISELIRSIAAPAGEVELPPKTRRAAGLVKLPEGVSDRKLIEDAIQARHGR